MKKLSIAQNAMYNTIGSCFYLACQWLVTVMVSFRLLRMF